MCIHSYERPVGRGLSLLFRIYFYLHILILFGHLVLSRYLGESHSELQILVRSLKQISLEQIETGVLYETGCGDGARVICLFARMTS